MVVGRQPHEPAAFTPGEISGIHFQRLSRPQGAWFLWGEPRKKFPVTPTGIDPWTVRLVAQCLNHYATPGPNGYKYSSPNTIRENSHIMEDEMSEVRGANKAEQK